MPDPWRAAQLLAMGPETRPLGLFCSCALGDKQTIGGLLSANPELLNTPTGPFEMPPLIAVTLSSLIRLEPFGFDLYKSAELLLDLGADVNQTWINPAFPDSPLSALYGAAGLNHNPELARLLLDRGANPNDNESLYHSVESPDLTCTRLLLEAGADANSTNVLKHMLDFDNIEGLRLLLAHGAPPNEFRHAIHRRRSPAHFEELLNAGATPEPGLYRVAMINGLPELAALFPEEPLTDVDTFIAACARGERPPAQPQIFSRMDHEQLQQLPLMAQARRSAAVKLMVEMGWPVAVPGGDIGGSALNHAVFNGDADLTRFLLAHGANWQERHAYNDNVMGTLGYASRNRLSPGMIDCAKALIESGMPVPDADRAFSPELHEYFSTLQTKPRHAESTSGSSGTTRPM